MRLRRQGAQPPVAAAGGRLPCARLGRRRRARSSGEPPVQVGEHEGEVARERRRRELQCSSWRRSRGGTLRGPASCALSSHTCSAAPSTTPRRPGARRAAVPRAVEESARPASSSSPRGSGNEPRAESQSQPPRRRQRCQCRAEIRSAQARPDDGTVPAPAPATSSGGGVGGDITPRRIDDGARCVRHAHGQHWRAAAQVNVASSQRSRAGTYACTRPPPPGLPPLRSHPRGP